MGKKSGHQGERERSLPSVLARESEGRETAKERSGMRATVRRGSRLAAARAVSATRAVTTCKESRIGKKPVLVGKSEVKLEGQVLTVKGPLGTLTREFPSEIAVTMSDDKSSLSFTKTEETKKSKQLHGLCRTLGQNMVTGVVDGWEKKLSLIGVGYRAAMKGSKQIELQLGYIHPVVLDLPEGVKAEVDKSQTAITITGYDKEVVGNFAAVVRSKRPPEVYKGKGIRYADEFVRIKEGKAGKK